MTSRQFSFALTPLTKIYAEKLPSMNWFIFGLVVCVRSKVRFDVNQDASFSIIGENGFKFESGNYMLRNNNKTFSTADKTLTVKFIDNEQRSDVLGKYTKYTFHMTPVNETTGMIASIRHYKNRQLAVFKQDFPIGLKFMSLYDALKVTSAFPTIKVSNISKSMYINPCDEMAGWTKLRKGSWNAHNMTNMCGGVQGGPFFIFDKTDPTTGHLGQIVTISAFSKFTVHFTEINTQNNELWFGLPGKTDAMPDEGFDIETIISYSDQGFYQGVQKWGDELKSYYGKSTYRRETDDTVNYLSYWTDAGAYYYYHTEPNKTYSETLTDINAQKPAAFRSWNFDSWWYERCPNKGVKSWTALEEVFPDGMEIIYQETSLPVIAHNRWWCNETDYAKRSGGKYEFIFDDSHGAAVPIETKFWEDLFHNSTKWGLRVYLQDWLDAETNYIEAFNTDLRLERQWLLQMGEGARVNGVNILYCMTYTRHMLQSVEIDNVVSFRASDDYLTSGNSQWEIGLTSAWIYAVGLAPFKDTFWTTTNQPGNPKYDNKTETHPMLESAIATLSTGTVGISDKINHTNVELVAKSTRPDGLILKPSRPLVVPDFLIWDLELHSNGTIEYETWSEVARHKFGIILVYNQGSANKQTREYHLQNYQFQKGVKLNYTATFVEYKGNEQTKLDQTKTMKWKNNRFLEHSTINTKNDSLMVSTK